jgi:hypothetical protein
MKLKQPIAIKVTQEQFDIDFNEHLKKLERKKPKRYAEISLRIDGVLTRFIAESEYKSKIDSYEYKIKEIQSSMYKIMEAVAEKEKEEQSEVKKTWEYENGVPVNFKVTVVDNEYDFIHPHEHKRIVNELKDKIVELEELNKSYKALTLYLCAVINKQSDEKI